MVPPIDTATGVTLASFTAADRHALNAVQTGAAALSFGGSAFIVLCYILFKELHKFSFKLVFFLALSVRSPFSISIAPSQSDLIHTFFLI